MVIDIKKLSDFSSLKDNLKQGMVENTFNHITQEVEAGSSQWVPG